MDEKIIIRGNKGNVFALSIGIGFVIAAIVLGVCLMVFEPKYYFETSLFGALVAGIVVTIFLLLWLKKIDIVVTDKRVYGTSGFGKRVDLPIDSVTAVGTGAFKGIAITTASGAIKFAMIKNRDEIHSEISKLIVERQSKKTESTVIKQEIKSSNADEIKKYKDLLDMGAITQEEFDTKKKEIWGL